jgi:MerR family redox-sensitive transcriptional activator SoxR
VTTLTIGEAARRAGVRTSALRYYEGIGLLPAPRRVSGRRRYDGEVLRALGVIRLAKQAGFTMAETRTLLPGFSASTPPSPRWRALARRKLAEIDALISRAEHNQWQPVTPPVHTSVSPDPERLRH